MHMTSEHAALRTTAKGVNMNAATRKTRACTVGALDGELKAAIRAHGTGITFIVLEAEADGQKFRRVLDEAMNKAAK
jgi:hypothetical protein